MASHSDATVRFNDGEEMTLTRAQIPFTGAPIINGTATGDGCRVSIPLAGVRVIYWAEA